MYQNDASVVQPHYKGAFVSSDEACDLLWEAHADHLVRINVKAIRYMDEARKYGDMVLDVEVPETNPINRVAKVIERTAVT